jgi:NAD(P)-dependent dehydrogenase (short-subunit alcohol dehydrogenase family)
MASHNGKKPERVALVTGGMGGLGETIATKMVDAGDKVVVTYSPGNTKHKEWVAGMKDNGYDILAVQCDVADIDSSTRAVGDVQSKMGAINASNEPVFYLLALAEVADSQDCRLRRRPQQ